MPRMFMVAVVALLVTARAGAAAAEKFGYVDLHRALEETKQGKAAKERMKALFAKKQKEFSDKEQELRAQKADLDKQAALLKPDALVAAREALGKKLTELQELYMRLQQEVSKKEIQLLKEIFSAAKKVIDQVAAQGGYTMIFEKTESSVLYAAAGLDITDEVIKRMNAGGGAQTPAKTTKPARARP